jgi:hypothetical protein
MENVDIPERQTFHEKDITFGGLAKATIDTGWG